MTMLRRQIVSAPARATLAALAAEFEPAELIGHLIGVWMGDQARAGHAPDAILARVNAALDGARLGASGITQQRAH